MPGNALPETLPSRDSLRLVGPRDKMASGPSREGRSSRSSSSSRRRPDGSPQRAQQGGHGRRSRWPGALGVFCPRAGAAAEAPRLGPERGRCAAAGQGFHCGQAPAESSSGRPGTPTAASPRWEKRKTKMKREPKMEKISA